MITLKEHCIQNDISFIEKDGVLHAYAMYDEDGNIEPNWSDYGKSIFYYPSEVDFSQQSCVFYSDVHLREYEYLNNIEFKLGAFVSGKSDESELVLGSNIKYGSTSIVIYNYRKVTYMGTDFNNKPIMFDRVTEFESDTFLKFSEVSIRDGFHCKLINCDADIYSCDMRTSYNIPFEYRKLYSLYHMLPYTKEENRFDEFYRGLVTIKYDIKGIYKDTDDGRVSYGNGHKYFEDDDMGALADIFELYDSHRKLFYGLN